MAFYYFFPTFFLFFLIGTANLTYLNILNLAKFVYVGKNNEEMFISFVIYFLLQNKTKTAYTS
jgi:hypothetical protein